VEQLRTVQSASWASIRFPQRRRSGTAHALTDCNSGYYYKMLYAGCLLVCRMLTTELKLVVLDAHEQHGSIATRVQIGVQLG
jgi:hypothetical protein